GAAAPISRSRSRPPPARSCWNVPSSALPASRLCPGCWARASAVPTPWKPSCWPASSVACRCEMWRRRWPRRFGPEAARGKSTVCRICQAIKEEFDAFTTGDLGGVELDYLFLDGTHFRYHPGAPAEPILVAWGVTTTGGPVLLGLAPGTHEGTDPWAGFLEDLVARGLGAPLLVITDGAPGLCSAVELAFPRSLRQRCLIHRSRQE